MFNSSNDKLTLSKFLSSNSPQRSRDEQGKESSKHNDNECPSDIWREIRFL